ncbi:GNAT family N-acetyltransferase [Sphingobacterium sp. N143]|uniref:GNAT family N-acetyltransferase n=1 Tax=Sphingobacterium sp. N143 TaxID=2746727 RepID=UPI0025778D53|nr:GNAT family N-acetyltransferase [Sphingobacterium sp. N143]MDM1294223.1 GNAT family N-acetyltransferase [Sphingobacterium sp. N143]
MSTSEGSKFVIEKVERTAETTISALADLTMNVVRHGASIGFMDTLNIAEAIQFWTHVLTKVEQGKTILLIAKDVPTGQIVGTVQLQIDLPSNQSHRADLAKMLVHNSFRRKGIAKKLLQQIELNARALHKSLIVLDTVTDSPAYALYLRCGWKIVGDIPNYAFFPDGSPCSTTYFYKSIE